MRNIITLFFCLFLSIQAFATTETLTTETLFTDILSTQTILAGENIEVTVIVVEFTNGRDDLNSTNITKEPISPNDDVLQDFSIILPLLNTPEGTAATISGMLRFGDNIWTFVNESVVKIGSGRLVVDTKILAKDTQIGTEKLISKEPYDTVTIAGTVQFPIVEFIEVGVDITATPTVKENGIVNLLSTIKISEVMREAPEERQTTVPVTSSRDITTNIDLVVGRLSVIGEMNMMKRLDVKSGIPFLRNIPILGNLIFSTNKIIYAKTKLCIVAGVQGENKEAMKRYNALLEENKIQIQKKFPFK